MHDKFGANVLDATKRFEKLIVDKKEIEGLPATVLGLAAQKAKIKVRSSGFSLFMCNFNPTNNLCYTLNSLIQKRKDACRTYG